MTMTEQNKHHKMSVKYLLWLANQELGQEQRPHQIIEGFPLSSSIFGLAALLSMELII